MLIFISLAAEGSLNSCTSVLKRTLGCMHTYTHTNIHTHMHTCLMRPSDKNESTDTRDTHSDTLFSAVLSHCESNSSSVHYPSVIWPCCSQSQADELRHCMTPQPFFLLLKQQTSSYHWSYFVSFKWAIWYNILPCVDILHYQVPGSQRDVKVCISIVPPSIYTWLECIVNMRAALVIQKSLERLHCWKYIPSSMYLT